MAGQEWSSGPFDCWEDKFSCCYAFWCWPCFACTISEGLGESRLLPLCDLCSPAVAAIAGIPLCVPPVALSFRTAVRKKYGIKGTLCDDIMMSCICNLCVWCQIDRELKHHNNSSTVQSQTPVTIQPVSSHGK